jgi:hypothetical protein
VTKRVGQHNVSSTCRLFWIFVSRRQEVLQLREIAFAVSRTSQLVQYVHFLVAIYPSSLCISLRPKYLCVSILLESYSVQILISRITIFPIESYYSDGNHILINPLNAELNSICHLLILLGDLTFMGPCIVSIF